uniref:40S ribosomal protein S7 n=1 Tax=Suricata suricatta TaxID=37032 RepID=A0A673V3Q5_SURSU
MFSSSMEIMKPNGRKLDNFVSGIYQALFKLEMNSDFKAQLRELNITAAREIGFGGGPKVIAIFIPVSQLKSFQKILVWLVCELEQKFTGKHSIFIARRRVLPWPTQKSHTQNKQQHPRSCTLTGETVGKTIHGRWDGSLLIKVHLDRALPSDGEHKSQWTFFSHRQWSGQFAVGFG